MNQNTKLRGALGCRRFDANHIALVGVSVGTGADAPKMLDQSVGDGGQSSAYRSVGASFRGSCALPPLDRRAWHRATRTEYAAIARQWLEFLSAALAHIKELAGVGRHLLGR